MIRSVITAVIMACAAYHAAAQDREYHVYYCQNGKVARSGATFTRSEMWVFFKTEAMLPPRPDFGRFVFVHDDNWRSAGRSQTSWERTSTMARKCREENACADPQTGRAVATLAGPATAGDPPAPDRCDPELTIDTARCTPDGRFQAQTMTGTADQLRAFTGLDASGAQGRVLYWPASGRAEWRDGPVDALRRDCETSGMFRDGTWHISMVSDDIAGCPAQVSAMVRARVPLAETTRHVRWSTPPNPVDLLPDTAQLGPWSGSGRTWQLTYAPEATQDADVPVKVDISFGFQGQNAELIDIQGHVQVRAAPVLAQIAGFMGNCTYDLTAVARWEGP